MKKNSGFSFVEIMVCVVILSVGLLGLLGLQARGLKSNVSANQRTQATLLAYNMIDRMRANVAEAGKGAASVYVTTNISAVTSSDITFADSTCQPSSVSGTPATTCTSAKMALNDLVQWNRDLTAQFCGGDGKTNIVCNGSPLGEISFAAATGNIPATFTITISWDDNRNDYVDNKNLKADNSVENCYTKIATPIPLSSGLPAFATPVQFDPCFRTSFQL